jgi:hypothetical protein
MFEVRGEVHARTESGKIGVGKDIRVIADEVTAWKERKGHRLTPAMITGVFGKGLQTLVIGIGASGAIDCSAELIEFIRERGIGSVIVQRTPEACETYNRLYEQGIRVALLAHATC